MAKLSSFGSSGLSRLTPKIGAASRADAEKERLAARDRTVEWRAWYRSKEWFDLRRVVFARDRYVCQHTGVPVTGRAPAPNSPVAHHKVPHRGDPVLFWDVNNLETVSKHWHDTVAQARERAAAGALEF